jgi:carbonic anhydrase
VRPSIDAMIAARDEVRDLDALIHDAVRANVRASTEHLRHGSPLLERLIHEEGLAVVGAEYSLESGIVAFFDGVPMTGREGT